MRRIANLGFRSLSAVRPVVRCYAAPAAKYVEIFQSDFPTAESYPVELLGGPHIDFAKLLFAFATKTESKNYKLYVDDFAKLDGIIQKAGPFWAEEPAMESATFSSLSPGFKFVLGWMQSEGAVDSLPYVESAYKELYNEASKNIACTIVTSKAKESCATEVSAAEAAAKEIAKSEFKDYKLVFEYKVDPAIGGGYTFEVGSIFVNKSAVAASSEAALAQASGAMKDWTALPAMPPKPTVHLSETLQRLLGADADDLASADKADLKYGA
jgi:hypothetical protein|mmetsp:Transcript_73388/g.123610  ORF Transcript_73388/g.123610 Transcript_73388/m.123610 type:complete len:269 (+) Transcript_73388:82-888(+)|eukprot:CAMPEP_0174285182 /NCGR_PEP_ID=MMETSP0809-20121228/7959_1 /TAXON_ID=73025 ORGANISM="Eutreptiella gymnastica-like, Strain CCMP1594" /NCGR_SAMPLE_ID=MMETSP0809 /ASSEMBLY_ACC=CAM_ASM_000658 /LENGTH=268 /DNA_ID=CAMNT_0015380881 /DNA_START=36 /DNA_END=842 /DNA_ORIENTATION=+